MYDYSFHVHLRFLIFSSFSKCILTLGRFWFPVMLLNFLRGYQLHKLCIWPTADWNLMCPFLSPEHSELPIDFISIYATYIFHSVEHSVNRIMAQPWAPLSQCMVVAVSSPWSMWRKGYYWFSYLYKCYICQWHLLFIIMSTTLRL